MVVTRGGEQRLEARQLSWFSVSALPWLAGAVAQGWAREVLWVLALAVDYAAATLGWPTPGLGRVHAAELSIAGEYLAEPQRQFFIIALGEVILVTGLTITSSSSSGFDAGREAAAVVAFATTALLWRIYIYRAGQVLGTAVAAAPDPFRVGLSAALYAHPVMAAGLVAISVGGELVITHPGGHIQSAWIAVIFGGPAPVPRRTGDLRVRGVQPGVLGPGNRDPRARRHLAGDDLRAAAVCRRGRSRGPRRGRHRRHDP